MKVFILTEGGRKLGLGHVARCVSIAEAFAQKNISPQFVVRGDRTLRGMLRGKRCRFIDWIKDERKLLALIADADIVVVDSILAGKRLRRKIAESVRLPVFIDDYRRLDYSRGTIVDWTVFAEEINRSRWRGLEKLLGVRYAALRKEFWSVPAKRVRRTVSRALVFFGGSDVRNMTPRILRLLRAEHPHLHRTVVIGGSFKNSAEIEKLRDERTVLIHSPGAAEVRNLMLDADVAIAAGGQTLYELARVGVPTVAVLVVDNQADDVRGWAKAGSIDYAGRWNDARLDGKILARLEGLSARAARLRRSQRGRRRIDGKGAQRLVGRILACEKAARGAGA